MNFQALQWQYPALFAYPLLSMDAFALSLSDAIDRSGMRSDHIAKQVGASANQLSQWKNGRRPVPAHYAPGLASVLSVAPEAISSAYARIAQAGLTADGREETPYVPNGNVRIPRLAGFGKPNSMDDCYLLETLAHRKLRATPPEHCRWTLQPNAAMSPLIERDDVLLIDVRAVEHADIMDGALYAFALWGRPDVRRVFVRRDHLLLVAHSPEVERIEVHSDDMGEFKLFGMVVGWL